MARSPVPGPLVLGNAGELKIQWDFGGRKRLNVLHFTGTSTKPVNQANTDSVSSQIKSLFASSGLLILTSRSYAITNCTVRDMSTATSAEYEGADKTPTIGDSTGDSLPAQIALVASLKTDKRGKNYHGRVYIPGASELSSDGNGLVDAGYSTAVQAFVEGIRAYLAGFNWPMAVVSRAYPADDAAGLPAKSADFANVVSVVVDNSFDTQRRRKI